MRNLYLPILFLFCINGSMSAQENEGLSLKINQFSGLPLQATVNNVIVDNNGIVWVATFSGLYLINPSLGTAELQSKKSNVQDVVFTENGQWMAYNNVVVDLNSNEEIELGNIGRINDLALVDKSMWVATDAGLFQITLITKKIVHLTTNNSDLKSNTINFIHQDKQNIIWLGTNKGYVRIERDKWNVEDEKYKMLLTYENNEGQWILSEDDLFLINQYNRYFPVGIEEGLIQGKVKDFTIDNTGKIYIVSDILVRYDPYKNRIDDFIEDVAEITSNCTSIERDRNDNIWIGTENNGLFVVRFSDNSSDALYANLALTNEVKCHGDTTASLEVIVVGGLPPYTFQWADDGSNSNIRNNLSSGSYSILVSDQAGQSFKSTKLVPEPDELMIRAVELNDQKTLDKSDGSISIKAIGGTGNLTYEWSNGMSGNYISNLSSGEYSLTISDARGCHLSRSFLIGKPKYIPELTMGKITVGTTLRIEKLFFEADSTNLKEENFPILDEIHDFLLNNPEIKIEIGGHTNTIPSHEYCDKLSTSRAKTVATYLYNQGIIKDRITYVGYGKRKPLSNENSSLDRRKNQRVELKIIAI